MTTLAFGPSAARDKRLPAVVDALKRWTRDALQIEGAAVVAVNELACSEPGCSPRETVILVMREGAPTRKLSVHKAMIEVTEDDVRLGWNQSAIDGPAASSDRILS